MLHHIVLFAPKPETAPGDWDHLREAILDLPNRIDGIAAVSWGANVSPEGIGQGYETGFVMTFVDASARDAYLPHPAHLAVIPAIQALVERTLVFDLDA